MNEQVAYATEILKELIDGLCDIEDMGVFTDLESATLRYYVANLEAFAQAIKERGKEKK